MDIYKIVKPYTICSKARVNATINAVKHVIENNIEGDFIECGVFKGGQVMAMILALNELKAERDIYLYDTFEGMPAPEEWEAKNKSGSKAIDKFNELKIDEVSSHWCRSTITSVRNLIYSLPYNEDKIHFVKGMVEDTLPKNKHKNIALLRLDTDWYSSTKIELDLLFPKLLKGGYLIIDDYGHWSGAKKAVDEYITNNKIKITLYEDDGTGRSAIKL